eukprot:scaffold226415_cov19-Tisochrysis_lutea.AAC.1
MASYNQRKMGWQVTTNTQWGVQAGHCCVSLLTVTRVSIAVIIGSKYGRSPGTCFTAAGIWTLSLKKMVPSALREMSKLFAYLSKKVVGFSFKGFLLWNHRQVTQQTGEFAALPQLRLAHSCLNCMIVGHQWQQQ